MESSANRKGCHVGLLEGELVTCETQNVSTTQTCPTRDFMDASAQAK